LAEGALITPVSKECCEALMNVWIDGSPALRQTQQGRIAVVYEDGRTFVAEVGSCTVNEAEYLGLIEALKGCKEGALCKKCHFGPTF